jgi:hypothetical protein
MRDVQPIAEEWREIDDWPDYAVSTLGRVKRISSYGRGQAGTIRKNLQFKSTGYPCVTLTNRDGRRKMVSVHRLVAIAFLGTPPFPGAEVNHKDSDRTNCRVENLEWTTASGNRLHGYEVGACEARGESNGYAKLTESAVIDIRLNAGPGMWETLAARHRVSAATVRDVAARRTWRHI